MFSNTGPAFLQVDVSMDGGPLQVVTAAANQTEPNGHTHGWTFYPGSYPGYTTYASHDFTFYAYGVDSSGNQDGSQVPYVVTINAVNCPPVGDSNPAIQLNCTNDGTAYAQFHDPNGATTGFIVVSYPGVSDTYPNQSSPAAWNISKEMDLNDVSVTLYVYDVGPGQSGTNPVAVASASHTHCDHPPTGTISGACVITGHATDQDSPGTPLQVTLYLDGDRGSSIASTSIWTDSSGNFTVDPRTDANFSGHFLSFKQHTVYAYAAGVNGFGQPNGVTGELSPAPLYIFCPPAPTCHILPGSLLAGVDNTITIDVFYTSQDAPDSNYTVAVSVNGGAYDPKTTLSSGASTTSATYTYTYKPPAPGAYAFKAKFYGKTAPYSQVSIDCDNGTSTTMYAYDRPYLKTYGSDVITGGAFDSGSGTCSNGGTSMGEIGFPGTSDPLPAHYGIRAWNNGDSAYTGAGSQFAAFAIGHIQDFSSAAMRSAIGSPGPANGLSFANTSGTYGGDFGGTNCIHNWFADEPNSNATAISPSSGNNLHMNPYFSNGGGANGSGAYYLDDSGGGSSLEIDNAPNAQLDKDGSSNGKRLLFYVKGDVYIANNLTYVNSAGHWTQLADVPSFWLVVQGDIFIDHSVSQLDGVYVAQPRGNGTGGSIFTCADRSGPVALGSITGDSSDPCAHQLVVNGAFIAQNVELLRSYGSLRAASGFPNEYPYSAAHDCKTVPSSSAPVCAGEVFNFSPEVYLAPPPGLGAAVGNKYDSIQELPPVL